MPPNCTLSRHSLIASAVSAWQTVSIATSVTSGSCSFTGGAFDLVGDFFRIEQRHTDIGAPLAREKSRRFRQAMRAADTFNRRRYASKPPADHAVPLACRTPRQRHGEIGREH